MGKIGESTLSHSLLSLTRTRSAPTESQVPGQIKAHQHSTFRDAYGLTNSAASYLVRLIGTSKKELFERAMEAYTKELFMTRLPTERKLLKAELAGDVADTKKHRAALNAFIVRDNGHVALAQQVFKANGGTVVPPLVMDALIRSLGKVPTARPKLTLTHPIEAR